MHLLLVKRCLIQKLCFSLVLLWLAELGTIGLAFCMLRAKSERYKSFGKLGVVPSIFNINEPLIFGVRLC